MKKLWIIAVCLIAAGLLLCLGVLIAIRFDVSGLSTDQLVTKEYVVTDPFKYISLAAGTADVRILPSSDGNTCRVVCCQKEKTSYQVTVEEETLRIQMDDQRRWYDYISLFSLENTSVTVYVPAQMYRGLNIKGNTGDVYIAAGTSFASANIDMTTGDVVLDVAVGQWLSVKTSTGDVEMEAGSVSELSLATTTGRIKVRDLFCQSVDCKTSTGDILLTNTIVKGELRATVSTGDVTLEACDAETLYLKTSTGDVKGTLLTDKVFLAQSDTGRVNVPKTTEGGRCEIITDTGDIRMEILPAE